MIDLHTHVLPDVDDGPRTLPESLALAESAAVGGTRVLVATPHLRADHPDVRLAEIPERCRQLETRLAAAGAELEILAGAEVDLDWALDATDEELQSATYRQRGTDVLLETPYSSLTPQFEQIIFELFTSRGIRVLLAHPERNPTFQRDPDRLATLVKRGALVQVTADSLTRTQRRSRVRRLAHALVDEGLAHVIATDAHGVLVRRATLSEGVAAAARIDPVRAPWMVTGAPAAVLTGEPLRSPRPRQARRRRLLQRRPRGPGDAL